MKSKKSRRERNGRPRRRSSPAGLTLLELLIAVSLFSFVGLGFAAMYGTAQSYLTDAVSASATQGEAALAMEHLTRSLRDATTVAFDATLRKLRVTYRPDPADPSATRVMTYQRLSGGQLRWHPDEAAPSDFKDLTGNLSVSPEGFEVTNPSGSAVTASSSAVRVTLTMVVGRRTVRLTSTAHLRGFGQSS